METHRSPEIRTSFKELPNLQARLLFSNGEIKNSISDTALQSINSKSGELRTQYWEDRVQKNEVDDDFNRQMEEWESNVVEILNTDSIKDRVTSLSRLFDKAGLGQENFTRNDVRHLYGRYFVQREGELTGVEMFIQDVLSAYTNADGDVDYESLKRDADSIYWFSTIFGIDINEDKKTWLAEIISQAVLAEARVRTNKEELKTKVVTVELDGQHKLREVEGYERELLEYISYPNLGEVVLAREPEVRQPETPPTQPPADASPTITAQPETQIQPSEPLVEVPTTPVAEPETPPRPPELTRISVESGDINKLKEDVKHGLEANNGVVIEMNTEELLALFMSNKNQMEKAIVTFIKSQEEVSSSLPLKANLKSLNLHLVEGEVSFNIKLTLSVLMWKADVITRIPISITMDKNGNLESVNIPDFGRGKSLDIVGKGRVANVLDENSPKIQDRIESITDKPPAEQQKMVEGLVAEMLGVSDTPLDLRMNIEQDKLSITLRKKTE